MAYHFSTLERTRAVYLLVVWQTSEHSTGKALHQESYDLVLSADAATPRCFLSSCRSFCAFNVCCTCCTARVISTSISGTSILSAITLPSSRERSILSLGPLFTVAESDSASSSVACSLLFLYAASNVDDGEGSMRPLSKRNSIC